MDNPCRYNSGSASATRGDFRAQAGRIAEENRCRSPVPGSTRLSLTRGADPHRARRRGHLPRLMVAVADHQPVTVLVDLIRVRVDVGGDLGLQRRRQHLPGTVAHDLIEQRAARLVGLGPVVDYLEHGRTFPSRPPTPALIDFYGLRIILGKVRRFTSPRRGPSGSDHVPVARRGPVPSNATVKQRMARKLATKRGRAVYARRKTIVEPVFGQMATLQNAKHLLLRGLDGARGEWLLLAACHNLRKLHSTIGTDGLTGLATS